MPPKPLQPVHVFCIGVAVLGAAAFAVVALVAPFDPGSFISFTFIALALGVLLGEFLPMEVPRPFGDGEVTVSTMFSFALLLSAGLVPAVVAQALASAAQDAHARKPLWRVGFNVGQYALTLLVADLALVLFAGHPAPLGSQFDASGMLAATAAAGAFFATNLLLVTRATSLY